MLTAMIMIIAVSLPAFATFIVTLLRKLDRDNPTLSLPPVGPKKTIAEMLKEALASPPLGCMWEVKDIVKHQRRLPSGIEIFDGTVDNHYANITLITPFGSRPTFSLMIQDSDFEAKLKNNVKIALASYNKELETRRPKAIENGWDGLYN